MNFSHINLLIALFLTLHFSVSAGVIEGTVKDESGEPLVAATVVVNETMQSTYTDIDGNFSIRNVPKGGCTITVSYLGFTTLEEYIVITDEDMTLHFELKEDMTYLSEVVVSGRYQSGSEVQARTMERDALHTMNIVSAQAIELSPDITVAQIIQRVSGLSVERNENGDGQHAIIRGMNKRYNYTLVNGIKIPSPDDKNRYVPLDIFPAQMLERLEVSKSLLADMEGDAIGGVMNMVMKSAPDYFMVDADLQVGYNQINSERGFWTYDRSVVNRQSPEQQFGGDYSADISDFSTGNIVTENIVPMPDILGSITVGDRFFGGRLGVMLGASIQTSYRGTDSDWYDVTLGRTGSQLVALDDFQERQSSTYQQRLAGHARLDYKINRNHNLGLYLGRYDLNDFHVREITETTVDGRNFDPENGNLLYKTQTRTRSTYQSINNATLQGDHRFGSRLQSDWSVAYSLATNERPDNAVFTVIREQRDFEEIPGLLDRRNSRRWENHSDRDFSVYLNFKYNPNIINDRSVISFGGLFRDRDRGSYFNRYTFDPIPLTQEQGVDWNKLDEITMRVNNPRGNTSDPLNFDSYEQIGAGYVKAKFEVNKTEFVAGVRSETTVQGYFSRVPLEGFLPHTEQLYTDILPSAVVKHKFNKQTAVRASYFKAINRPGFFEIVDFVLLEDEDFNLAGNPDLTRAIADNIDLRFEYFPKPSEQIMVGLFYKHIVDPIETVFGRTQSLTLGTRVLRPENLGEATNFGAEFDVIKYFGKIGFRANYTYTNSTITTDKASIVRENPNDPSSDLITINVEQRRPLQGQADHIANFSLMYKDVKRGTDAQISLVYVGERLEFVSPFVNNDHWSRPITIIDLSIEQRINNNFIAFIKINNLINSPYELYIRNGRNRPDQEFAYQDRTDQTFIRRDLYWQSYRVGMRFKMN